MGERQNRRTAPQTGRHAQRPTADTARVRMAPWFWFRVRFVGLPLLLLACALMLAVLDALFGAAAIVAILLLWVFFAVRNREQWLPNWRRPVAN